MSALAVAAFHDTRLPATARDVEAMVWVRVTGLPEPGAAVSLRVWTPAGAKVTALIQAAPSTADLLPRAERIDDHTLVVGVGRWSDGVHEIELRVAVAPRSPGDEMLVARVGVAAEGGIGGEAVVATTWTEDPPAPSRAVDRTHADLTTGASPKPRHVPAASDTSIGPCPGCGEPADDGDRFCEACGRELPAG